ncbi:uncharacterized protein LOC128247662 [Octopus bimaculoides]|uniref:uncharacterized protein LOC128247662 n=1 Tax=Octopus bimaculoides TaxID=37653 RepID=UPI0022E362CD|nr:uncharacterized protein LOC128247662 [Octopus bimaculoides]
MSGEQRKIGNFLPISARHQYNIKTELFYVLHFSLAPVFSDDEDDDDDSECQRLMLQKPPPVIQFPKERAFQPHLSSPEPSRYPQPTDIHNTPKERNANVAPPNLSRKSEQLLHVRDQRLFTAMEKIREEQSQQREINTEVYTAASSKYSILIRYFEDKKFPRHNSFPL